MNQVGEGDSAIDRAVVEARSLADRFHEAGHSLYLVGGVVRDQYLEHARPDPDLDHTTDARPGPDLDCTTDARPDQIKAVVADMADKIWDQGERFGTIGCRIGSRIFEITTHRADAYEPESRKPVVAFGDAIEPDLARRDFTVNAMALDLADGRIVDPFGGRADLDAGVLRARREAEGCLGRARREVARVGVNQARLARRLGPSGPGIMSGLAPTVTMAEPVQFSVSVTVSV